MKADDKTLNESFSAWLDDEADEFDMQRLVNYLKSEDLNQTDLAFSKQSQVSMALQGWGNSDVSGAVQQNISVMPSASEEHVSNNYWQVIKNNPWSLVASVALLVAIALPVMQQGDWLQEQLIANAVNQQETVVQTEILADSQGRLNKYLQKHLRQASLSSGHISFPYQSVQQLGS